VIAGAFLVFLGCFYYRLLGKLECQGYLADSNGDDGVWGLTGFMRVAGLMVEQATARALDFLG
jgi:hypothetical protein